MNGNNIISLKIGEVYTELGAKATDSKDGDLTSKIITTGTVDTSVAGTYIITYTVSDSAGNISKATRTIEVTGVTSTTPITPSTPETPETSPTPDTPSTSTNTVQ